MEKFELVIDGITYQGKLDDSGDVVLFVDNNDGTHMKKEDAMILGCALMSLASDEDED